MSTPRTDHVLQHGLMYTGKDELVFLCRDLERENAAQAETIAALRAEVERLKKELAANVIATNAEMKADAERYRWLRNANADDLMVCSGFDCETVGSSRVVGTYEQGLTGLVLDAAIDAARIQKARKAK